VDKNIKMKTILTAIGTRPEAIKMAKLIESLNQDPNFKHVLCSTGQHKELLQQVFDIFKIVPDVDLCSMTPNQTLEKITVT